MIYAELFAGFLKVGFFSFGGAYSAIPLIRDVVLSYGWLTDEALGTMIAISESTPGPIMVNLATYVGSSQAGLVGAALATLAVVLPSFFVILLAMNLLGSLIRYRGVQAVLQGIKPCMIGIILATGVYMTLRSCLTLSQTNAVEFRAPADHRSAADWLLYLPAHPKEKAVAHLADCRISFDGHAVCVKAAPSKALREERRKGLRIISDPYRRLWPSESGIAPASP